MTTLSSFPEGWKLMQRDQTIGPKNASTVPVRADIPAFGVHSPMLPSAHAVTRPKTERLVSHTHSEPPSEPVTEYHWIREVVSAKAFPRTSQGHDISAIVR